MDKKKYLGLGFGILNFSCIYLCTLVEKFTSAPLDMLKNAPPTNGVAFYEGYRYWDLGQMFQLLLILSIISILIVFFFKNQKKN